MRLVDQVTYWKDLAESRLQTIDTVYSYVTSSKFNNDNQCNVNDIVLRIRECQHNDNEYGR